MKHILLIAFSLFGLAAFSQSFCDSVNIVSVKYSAFSDTMIEVIAENYSHKQFDYPGFLMLDAQGDTISKEPVNFFVMGTSQISMLPIRSGMITNSTFEGSLELWSGFYTVKQCTWTDTFSLCPTDCRTIYPAFANWGVGVSHPNLNWWMLDSTGQAVASGTFDLSDSIQVAVDSVCLEPGAYTLKLDTASNLGGNPYLILSSTLWSIYQLQKLYDINDPEISFELYGACIDNSTGIERNHRQPLDVQVFSGDNTIRVVGDRPFDNVEVYDLSGRLISMSVAKSREAIIRLPDKAAGIYLVRVSLADRVVTKKVWVE